MIYLDNAATTKVSENAVKEMVNAMTVDFGNPSSLYDFGMRAEKLVTDSRNTIANLLNVRSENVFFTSCGTEGNNISINGSVTNDKKEEFITTNIEHSSVFKTYNKLKENRTVHFVNVSDDFKVDDIIDLINEKNIYTISIDLPSGFDANGENNYGTYVDSDLIVCMQILKKGLYEDNYFRDKTVVCDIGLPQIAIEKFVNV